MYWIMIPSYQRVSVPALKIVRSVMHEPSFVNLSEAHLCTDCEVVGDFAIRCPRCQSQSLIAICRSIHNSNRIFCDGYLEEHVLKAA